MMSWEFERDGELVRVDPKGPLLVPDRRSHRSARRCGHRRRRHRGPVRGLAAPASRQRRLEPVLEPWWQRFSGPFLYYPGRRLVPAPLRAFIDFVKAQAEAA